MALQGSIKDFGLPDIFQLIGLQRKTGLLTLKGDKEHVTVTFEQGMVVHADSPHKRVDDRLGNVLVKTGKLSKENLDQALATQKATLQRLGHVMVDKGFISQQDLREALQVQVSGLVFRVFRWKDGDYHFEPADNVEFDRENFNPMSADFILMEGIRMVDEWPIIEKKIPTMDIVFRPAVDPSQIESGDGDGHGDEKGGASNRIRLSGEEERIFRKVDGVRTVQGIIDASGMGEFDTCRILYDLLNRNLVAQAGKGAAKAADAASAEPGSPALAWGVLAAAAVLAAVGVLVQRTTPFGVVGTRPLLQRAADEMTAGAARARLDRLDRGVLAARLVKGALPGSLDELVAMGLADASHLRDPWGRPYHYAQTSGGYLLAPVDAQGKDIAEALVERTLPPAPQ